MKKKAPDLASSSRKAAPSPVRLWKRIGFVGLCLLIMFGWTFRANIKDTPWIPVILHSALSADYSPDGGGYLFAPLGLNLIRDALNDFYSSSDPRAGQAYATLLAGLTTPVATVTAQFPGLIATATSTPVPGATPTPALNETAAATPTATQPPTTAPTLTSTPTATIIVPLPSQPAVTRPPRPTSTSISPTQPAPTQPPTSVPATATPLPTATHIPPTATHKPPTATRPPNPYPAPTIKPYP